MTSSGTAQQADEISSPVGPFPHSALDHQLCSFLELFIDLMYADVVLGDRCSRLASQALVTEQEATLRALLHTAANALPEGLQRAISTYCVRHVLLRAPELMLTSAGVSDALLQLADHLGSSGTSAPVGSGGAEASEHSPRAAAAAAAAAAATSSSIRDDVSALRERLGTKRYAHLIDALADAVMESMSAAQGEMSAAADRELEDQTRMLPSPFIQRFLPILTRFAQRASHVREARKRQREADLDRNADALLFPTVVSPAPLAEAVAASVGGEGSEPPSKQARVPAATEYNFSEDIQAAMATPASRAPPPHPRAPGGGRSGRPYQPHVDDSVAAGVAALQDASPSPVDGSTNAPGAPDEVSDVVVDPSIEPSLVGVPARGRAVTVAGNEASVLATIGQPTVTDGSNAGRAAAGGARSEKGQQSHAEAYVLSSRDVVERTYVLCASTNRYEPSTALGFFDDA